MLGAQASRLQGRPRLASSRHSSTFDADARRLLQAAAGPAAAGLASGAGGAEGFRAWPRVTQPQAKGGRGCMGGGGEEDSVDWYASCRR